MADTPKLPLDFLTDVTNQTQSIVHIRPQVVEAVPANLSIYNECIANYWAKKGVPTYFNKGGLLGSGGVSHSDLESFFKQFRKVMEDIIRTELALQEKTSEDFKDDFKILEHTYNNMINKLKKNSVSTNSDRILSTLHGFINSFIGTNHG